MDDSTDSKARKRTRRTAAQWRSIMARHEASGLSCEAFCAAEGTGTAGARSSAGAAHNPSAGMRRRDADP